MAVIVLIVKNRNYWGRQVLLPTVGWAGSFPLKISFLSLFWCPVLTSLTCTSPAFIEYLLSIILPKEISIFHLSCHRQRTLPGCLSGHSLLHLWRCCPGSWPVDLAPTPAHCMLEDEVAQPAGTCFFGADPRGSCLLDFWKDKAVGFVGTVPTSEKLLSQLHLGPP